MGVTGGRMKNEERVIMAMWHYGIMKMWRREISYWLNVIIP